MMQVFLSDQAAAPQWGRNPVISFERDCITLHLLADDSLRRIQQGGRRIAALGIPEVSLCGVGWQLEEQWAFAQGFQATRNTGHIIFAQMSAAEDAELQARIRVSSWVRDVVNRSPEDLYPQSLCESVVQFLQQLAPGSIRHRIVSGEQLRDEGWVGIYNVGRGSTRAPAMLQLEYCPPGCENAPVQAALVGKGITFDSGGYSLKASESMVTMRMDMGGAATVTGGLALAILRGLKARVSLILCCAENLVSGHAYKLGDILQYKNGVTVEIVNTDAEGRLVLADGLLFAGEQHAPLIIDAATLTGAAVTALGSDYHAVFTLDQAMRERYLAYAAKENEPHWPLPLTRYHQGNCPSAYADTANSRAIKGGGPGGASNAAGFLSRFVPNDGNGWVHLDLAACDVGSDTSLWAAGATALGIRTIAHALLSETGPH